MRKIRKIDKQNDKQIVEESRYGKMVTTSLYYKKNTINNKLSLVIRGDAPLNKENAASI